IQLTFIYTLFPYTTLFRSIRFFQKVHSNTILFTNILGLNTEEYKPMITAWQVAFNYTGPILCAKDQTKVSEMIEINKLLYFYLRSEEHTSELQSLAYLVCL